MFRWGLVLGLVGVMMMAAGCGGPPVPAPQLDRQLAFELTAAAAAMTPRHSGTSGARRQAEFIAARARDYGAAVAVDTFDDLTPYGPLTFRNVVAEVPGRSRRVVVVGCHYDAKKLLTAPDFAAANDGASGVGTLLAVIKALTAAPVPPRYTVRFVFFDGEECLVEYGPHDGLHGSRHYVEGLQQRGELGRCRAMILLDMIGDRDLTVMIPAESDPELRDICRQSAAKLGYEKYFVPSATRMLDDHTPFVRAGIPAIDLIDFSYGPDNSYWHTGGDTMDKIAATSLQTVGNTVLEMLYRLP
ncbi:MAG: M28 family metallopeptidase [Victivallales bacterium]|nr:M28 family metallopeptidase [Victivallales bacterium]